jgi:hypothetical protein
MQPFLLACSALLLIGQSQIAVAVDKPTVNFKTAHASSLQLTGSAIRKRFFLKIYRISHYMKWPTDRIVDSRTLFSLISSGNVEQRIELVFLRSVSRKQLENALIEGVKRNNPGRDLSDIEAQIKTLSSGFDKDVEAQTHLVLARSASDVLTVYFNDEEIIESTNKTFNESLWSIWFGEKPTVDKDELIKNFRNVNGQRGTE